MRVALGFFFGILGFISFVMAGAESDMGNRKAARRWFTVFLVSLAIVSAAVGGLIG